MPWDVAPAHEGRIMTQIELYYTYNLKYLKLGDYVRHFKQESIDEMLACIKNQDTPVKIRAVKEFLIPHKFSDKSKVIYTYEEIKEDKIFDYDKVCDDSDNNVSYGLYPVNERYHSLLGKVIYFCQDRNSQIYLTKEKDICTFLYSDWREVRDNILRDNNIGAKLTAKMFFTDAEMADMEL